MEDKNQKTHPQTETKVIVNGQTFHLPVVPACTNAPVPEPISAEEDHEGRTAPDHGICDYDGDAHISAAEFFALGQHTLFSPLFHRLKVQEGFASSLTYIDTETTIGKPHDWNRYMVQSSDGDEFFADNLATEILKSFEGMGKIMLQTNFDFAAEGAPLTAPSPPQKIKGLVIRVDPASISFLQTLVKADLDLHTQSGSQAPAESIQQFMLGKVFYVDPSTPKEWRDLLPEGKEITVRTFLQPDSVTGDTVVFDKVNVTKQTDPEKGVCLTIIDPRNPGDIPGTAEFKERTYKATRGFRNGYTPD